MLAAELINFTSPPTAPNGAWCWYQDERVIVDTAHPDGPLMLIGTVSFASKGDPEHGDIDVLWYNLRTGEQGTYELHDQLEADDHNGASFHIRSDGRYLAMYSKHSSDNLLRWRISMRPHDPTAWDQEQTFKSPARVCYTNVFPIQNNNQKQLINISRSITSSPTYFVSTDDGSNWTLGGVMFTGPGGNQAKGQRPYQKYASADGRTLHFITTDGHPRDENNGIYHGYLRDGKLYNSDGSVNKGRLSNKKNSPHRSNEFTTVLKRGQKFNGVAMHHAWTIDLHVDDAGHPYAAYSARANNNDRDHRFFYGRWTGSKWMVREIAKAGGYLYKRENDYTGLVALHPHRPDVLFISTKIDPRDGREHPHYEIFMGRTPDGGDSWAWSPVTWNSKVDNLRPVVPLWDADNTALLWLQGSIDTYRSWDSQVVGHIVKTDNLSELTVTGQKPVIKTALEPDPPAPPMSDAMTPEAVAKVGRAVAQWQLDHFKNPPSYGPHGYWRNKKKDWVWAPFYCGMLSLAQQTGDMSLIEATRKIASDNKWSLDKRPRHADDWAVGWTYAELYLNDEMPKMLAQQREQFDKLMQQSWDESLEWKKGIYNRELAWCDALFMGPPTLLRLATATGDKRYLEFGDRLWWKTTDYLYDKDDHLYYRDSSFFGKKEPNGKQIYWARGNGWVFAGLTRMLEDLPSDHPNVQRYVTLFEEMSAKLKEVQHDNGFWPAGLLDPVRWDKPETSGTAFFTYGLAWGINNGLLDAAEYLPSVKKGWEALVSKTDGEGRLSAVQPIGADPYDFDPEATMPYGVGGMLLAASEVYQLALLKGAPSMLITGKNDLNLQRLNETIEVPWSDIATGLPGVDAEYIAVRDLNFGDLLNTQVVDSDTDGTPDLLLFQAHFQAKQIKQFRIYKTKSARPTPSSPVFGRAVPERVDDYAWENDRIAFRIYGPALEPDNTAGSGIDVWTKSVRYPIINKWYQRKNYHTDEGEGGDFYSVGLSRGAGGIGIFAADQLWVSGNYRRPRHLANGPIRVSFEVEFEPWDTPLGKVREVKRITLDRGRNLNHITSTFEIAGGSGSLPIAVGIVERKGKAASEFGRDWVGYWEPQNGKFGHTGVGIVIPNRSMEVKQHTQTRIAGVGNKTKDETNTHTLAVVKVDPSQPLDYYVGSGWSQSGDFPDSNAWFEHLKLASQRIANPIRISIE